MWSESLFLAPPSPSPSLSLSVSCAALETMITCGLDDWNQLCTIECELWVLQQRENKNGWAHILARCPFRRQEANRVRNTRRQKICNMKMMYYRVHCHFAARDMLRFAKKKFFSFISSFAFDSIGPLRDVEYARMGETPSNGWLNVHFSHTDTMCRCFALWQWKTKKNPKLFYNAYAEGDFNSLSMTWNRAPRPDTHTHTRAHLKQKMNLPIKYFHIFQT